MTVLTVSYFSAVMQNRKSDQENQTFIRIYFYQKIRPKDPSSPFLGQNQTCSNNLFLTVLTVSYFSAVMQSRKSDQENLTFIRIYFYQKIRPKDPNSPFLGQNQTCSNNLFLTLRKSTFLWKYSIFKGIWGFFLLCVLG